MNIKHITLTLETTEARDVAKAMLRFWLYQKELARQSHTACKGRLEAGLRANEQALAEWRASDDLGFGGPKMPYSEAEIQQSETRLPACKKNMEEANAMAGYMINFITGKAHP